MFALAGGTLVDYAQAPVRLRHGVVVMDDTIVEVADEVPAGARVVDCRGCLILPGHVLCHTHLYSALSRGMPLKHGVPTTFVETLERIWWPLDQAIDEAILHASAFVGVAEALKAGVTTIYDHHASPRFIEGSLDVVARAFEVLGARGVLCYETTDCHGHEGARAGLAENVRFVRRVREHERLRGLIGAHASFTLEDATLRALLETASAEGAGLHVHLAEDGADNDDAARRGARSAAGRLLAAAQVAGGAGADAGRPADGRGAGGPLAGALLAHAVWASAEELEALGRAGARLVHNPRSNLNNAVGHASRVTAGAAAELPVGLGTDGIGADLFEEARAAFLRAREAHVPAPPRGSGEGFGGERVVAMLACGQAFAAQDFGLPFGRIEPGAPADLMVLDYRQPTPLAAGNFPYHYLFGLSSAHVRDVFVAGEQLVRDRRLTRIDEDALYADARAQAVRLWERM